MRRSRGQKPEYQLRIARERISILFDEAEKIARTDRNLAKRYVELARKIGMRYNVRIPRELKRRYCRYCRNFLTGGKHRLKNGVLAITCPSCGRIIHYPYKNKRPI